MEDQGSDILRMKGAALVRKKWSSLNVDDDIYTNSYYFENLKNKIRDAECSRRLDSLSDFSRT